MKSAFNTRIQWPTIAIVAFTAVVYFKAFKFLYHGNNEWMRENTDGVVRLDNGYGQYFFNPRLAHLITAIVCAVGVGLVMQWLCRLHSRKMTVAIATLAIALSAYFLSQTVSPLDRYHSWSAAGLPIPWHYIHRLVDKTAYLAPAILADLLAAFLVVGSCAFIIDRIRTGSIHWLSLSVAMMAAIVSVALITESHGPWYDGWRGVPFRWYEWSDIGLDRFYFAQFSADVAIALAFIFALTVITELLLRQRRIILIVVLSATLVLAMFLLTRYVDDLHAQRRIGQFGAPFPWGAVWDHHSIVTVSSWYAALFALLFSLSLTGATALILAWFTRAISQLRKTNNPLAPLPPQSP